MQFNSDSFSKRCLANNLFPSVSKCGAINFSRKLMASTTYYYYMNHTRVPIIYHDVKDVRVVLDSEL